MNPNNMNFKNFYSNTEQRIIDNILSLWATGDSEMQTYLRSILNKDEEKIVAKPVFQNMFPWEPYQETLGQLNGLFNPEFVTRLDKIPNLEYRFPADRHPYLHQVKSWKSALIDRKSILVTTGTGSGKTECFMLPVLQDIFTHNPNGTGVNAIFLYPLNALIGSQKKRMHAWCQALGNIKYAVYNRNTEETVPNARQTEAYPEIISRQNIRKTPPQIVFTNPTMLEYMLVRDKDNELLQHSQGTLRWILLDEAHTLTGSKAAEMALLIRRVIDAFNVNINQVRFAVTSATVGDGNDEALKKFMSDLCGINTTNIEIIKGKRILPDFDNQLLLQNDIDIKTAHHLRNQFLKPAIDTDDIEKIMGTSSLSDQLAYIDKLADISDKGQPILPVRGHFFARNINGLYACTNPHCTTHPPLPNHGVNSLTTISKKQCGCGHPLLELIACKTCGTYMLEGEKVNNTIKQSSKQRNDFFQVESDDDDDDDDENNQSLKHLPTRIILARQLPNKNFTTEDIIPIAIDSNGTFRQSKQSLLFEVNDPNRCPYCGDGLTHPFHFRLSATFLNRLMSDVILEQTDNANPVTQEMLWNGKKYISFTDSRQGTAKIAALINIDSETYWLRSQVYHHLTKTRTDKQPQSLNEEERIAYTQELENLKKELQSTLPILINRKKAQIQELEGLLNSTPPSVEQSRTTWQDMLRKLAQNEKDFKNLFYHNHGGNLVIQGNDYLNALLYNEFARRLPRERSLENLGMAKLVYPKMDQLSRPDIAITLDITEHEWKSLVKIALDYIIRNTFHYSISPTVRGMASRRHKSFPIYPSNTQVAKVTKWPIFERQRARPNRLSLLICAGLGYSESNEIDNVAQDQINELLESLWVTIRTNFLSVDGTDGGYKLNLEEKTAFELTDTLWLCPVKKRLLDATFRGYSPWISGKLTAANINSFKVENPVSFPMFPYSFNLDTNNEYNAEPTQQWIASALGVDTLRKQGLWNGLHERIINYKPLYLAGEHSAQQQTSRLEQLEAKFQDGRINILSCSTTMEMGVDIGGISVVVMSNVPPSPANYLQRTGRAGRRRENKSLAFTICAANPVGANVMAKPTWALDHQIAPPTLTFSSTAVVQRHLNAFLFGKFVQQRLAGINVKETIENFFFNNLQGHQESASQLFAAWLIGEAPLLLSNSLNHITNNTPLSDKSPSAIISKVYANFDDLSCVTKQKRENFEASLDRILQLPKYSEDSAAYKSINYQKNQFLHKNLLTHLAEEGFLPAGGIPTGVVDFNNTGLEDLRNTNASNEPKQLPSYHITRALSEYAPGMEIVIDGWNYTSAGISLKNNWGGEATKNLLQHCTACGHELIVEQSTGAIHTICPHCSQSTLRGIKDDKLYTEIIEPAGFAVDLFEEPTKEIKEASNVQYVEPLLIGVEPWPNASHPLFEYRDSKENAEIVYYNYGTGDGYSVCLECGRADANPQNLINHTRLRGGKNDKYNTICGGNDNPHAIRNNVLLVGRFQTDFFEIRCKDADNQLINDKTTLFSLGQVISKSLTTYLGIEDQEVNFGLKDYRGFSSIFLFDTAKGGAGYVSQCASYFEEICSQALNTLQNCNCTSACTKCLIDRQSQFHIENLDRYSAIAWLQRVVEHKVPTEVSAVLTNEPKKIVGSIKNEWARLFSKSQLKQVWLLLDFNDMDNCNTEDFLLLNQFKSKGITIHLVFRGKPKLLTNDQKLTLVQVSTWAKLLYTNEYSAGNLQLMGKALLDTNQQYDYFSNEFTTTLNKDWGNTANNHVYKQEASKKWALHPFDIQFDDSKQNIVLVKIPAPTTHISSYGIFNLFYSTLQNDEQQRLAQSLKGKKIHFTYSDRYLVTPVGCMLLVQFILAMKEKFLFEIAGLTLQVQKIKHPKVGKYIHDDFSDEESREEFMQMLANDCDIENLRIEVKPSIPHERFLSLKVDNKPALTIRPDAGIAHGWFVKDSYKYPVDLDGKTNLSIQQNLSKDLLYMLVFEEK